MNKRTEYRSSIKFCSLLGYTPTQTEKHLKRAYGDSNVSRALVFKWHKRFRDGRESVEEDNRAGRPPTAISSRGNMRVHWPISRQVTNGLMTGIVAVAAGCNVYSHWASSIIGITSSFTYVTWSLALYTTRADDPVGAVAVHLGGGLWGAVCVHLFQNGTGLIYTQEPMKVLLAVVWNFLAALSFAVGSIIVTGLVLAIPRALNYIPLNHVQEIEGIDMVCIDQQAYPNGSKVSPFTTDLIEDREGFMDSNPASPMSPELTSLTSPTSYSVSRYQQMCNELQNTSDVSAPYFQFSEKELPTFSLSPGDGDRRVWFSGDSLPDQVAPMTPLIDAYADRWGDLEF